MAGLGCATVDFLYASAAVFLGAALVPLLGAAEPALRGAAGVALITIGVIAIALGLGREILADAPAFVAGVVLATGTWQSGLALVSGSLHGRLRPSARGAIALIANVVVIALGLQILAQVVLI